MKLLLHACCGPCSLEPTRILREAGHDISLAYINSNIAPKTEYLRRRDTLFSWAKSEGIAVIEGPYEPRLWEHTAGRVGDFIQDAHHTAPSKEKQGTGHKARCRACYRLRLEQAAHLAASEGFDALGTTLSVSPYQDVQLIREELLRASTKAGIQGLFGDYRPFFRQGTQRSRALGMYTQNYCGCRFSEAEALLEREERKRKRAEARDERRALHKDERRAEEAERVRKKSARLAYAQKQAHKRAILKQLRSEQSSKTR